MALYSLDYDFLDKEVSSIKYSLFQLISDFGPNYQARFMISFRDIKNRADRERLTSTTLNDYAQYLEDHGFNVDVGQDSLRLSVNARSVVPIGNESRDLADALRKYRLRAEANGDYGNM
jgi:hypothetical protein